MHSSIGSDAGSDASSVGGAQEARGGAAVPFALHPESLLTEGELQLESDHFERIVAAFASYAGDAERTLAKCQRDVRALPLHQRRSLLPQAYLDRVAAAQRCIAANQAFYHAVIRPHCEAREDDGEEGGAPAASARRSPIVALTATESENLASLLRQVAREWSDEGNDERATAYGPMLAALQEEFDAPPDRAAIRVLVPGAGLGRLAYEISQLGFTCEGNEFSLFMLLTSEFFLTRASERGEHAIHPYVLPFSNTASAADQLRAVALPDVRVAEAPASFSMVAGDFLQVYSSPPPHDQGARASWSAVATAFFIDTARNIIDYIHLIHALLAPGGIWVNNGPLLYHFEGHHREVSIELSIEEVRAVAERVGFAFEREAMCTSPYAANARSLMQTVYSCWFFVARKV